MKGAKYGTGTFCMLRKYMPIANGGSGFQKTDK